MYQENFKFCEYAKASALRIPLRDAINTARAMPDAKMEQVINVLETALAHIRQGEADVEESSNEESHGMYTNVSDDPLDLLLGSITETEFDAS
jgi:hypothetical protein